VHEKNVVVIASNGVGCARFECDVGAWNCGRWSLASAILNLASDLEIALHYDAVSEFQRQEDQQASSAPEGQALIAKVKSGTARTKSDRRSKTRRPGEV